jgi:hypothetical protein
MHGPFTGVRGPFTPSQWMELEHQALIYKYITARVPVPSNLIIPLKKSLNPYGVPFSSAGSFPPNSCKLLPSFEIVRRINTAYPFLIFLVCCFIFLVWY